MTIHNPNLNPAQNIYNAPTQPQYAVQSRNRTIPLNQAQGSVHVSANLGGTGVQSGAAQNVNVSGDVVSNSGGGNTGHGGSARASGQSVARSSNRGQSLNNGGGNGNANANGVANRGGASQNANTGFVVHGHAQVQHPHIPPVNYGQFQAQYPHFPINHMLAPQAQVHPQGHHLHQNPNIPINLIQPRLGGVLGLLFPYVPRARGIGIPPSIQGVNRPIYAPRIQLPVLPVPFGYPPLGNMVINGWDNRWDGSGGFRGRGTGSRGGRGRGARDRRRR